MVIFRELSNISGMAVFHIELLSGTGKNCNFHQFFFLICVVCENDELWSDHADIWVIHIILTAFFEISPFQILNQIQTHHLKRANFNDKLSFLNIFCKLLYRNFQRVNPYFCHVGIFNDCEGYVFQTAQCVLKFRILPLFSLKSRF